MEPADDGWLADDAARGRFARDVPRAPASRDYAARVRAVAAPPAGLTRA